MSKNYIGKNIKTVRELQGLTQEQLAKKLGHDSSSAASYISKVESGKHKPSIGNLLKIAKALKTTAEALLA